MLITYIKPLSKFFWRGVCNDEGYICYFLTEVIKFYWLMLLLYPGELYRLMWASSICKPGEHRQQSKGEKNTQNYEPNEFDRMRVKQFLSETVAMHPQYWSRVVRVSSTNPILYASDAMVGRCRSTMRRLDNLKR